MLPILISKMLCHWLCFSANSFCRFGAPPLWTPDLLPAFAFPPGSQDSKSLNTSKVLEVFQGKVKEIFLALPFAKKTLPKLHLLRSSLLLDGLLQGDELPLFVVENLRRCESCRSLEDLTESHKSGGYPKKRKPCWWREKWSQNLFYFVPLGFLLLSHQRKHWGSKPSFPWWAGLLLWPTAWSKEFFSVDFWSKKRLLLQSLTKNIIWRYMWSMVRTALATCFWSSPDAPWPASFGAESTHSSGFKLSPLTEIDHQWVQTNLLVSRPFKNSILQKCQGMKVAKVNHKEIPQRPAQDRSFFHFLLLGSDNLSSLVVCSHRFLNGRIWGCS